MAVTRQQYTITATWTAVQLADAWKQMFIDAGLMTDWYDTFLNTVENRVLRLTNDAAKVYGYQYLWFMFTTSGVYVAFANAWTVGTHVPAGTQYLDYYATTTNAVTNHVQIAALTSTTNYTFTRYTSSGTTMITAGNIGPICIVQANIGTAPGWLDLDKAAAYSFFVPVLANSGTADGWRSIGFQWPYHLRRLCFPGRCHGNTTNTSYALAIKGTHYVYGGYNTTETTTINDPSTGGTAYAGAIRLPVFISARIPSYSANFSPIITGVDLMLPLNTTLPADFGLCTTVGATPAIYDTLTVTAGVEVWEVVGSTSSASTNGMCLLARTT